MWATWPSFAGCNADTQVRFQWGDGEADIPQMLRASVLRWCSVDRATERVSQDDVKPQDDQEDVRKKTRVGGPPLL